MLMVMTLNSLPIVHGIFASDVAAEFRMRLQSTGQLKYANVSRVGRLPSMMSPRRTVFP
jgi:hypothetical protein